MRQLALVGALLAALAVATAALAGPAPKPDVSPIFAQFVPSNGTTLYGVQVKEPAGRKKASIVWSLKPPANAKGCKSLASSRARPDVAVWKHGPEDGCSPNAVGDKGFAGTITVTVRDAAYVCTARYVGSVSGTSKYPTCRAG